jgi:hypothetical protein
VQIVRPERVPSRSSRGRAALVASPR